jgi:RecT family
MSNIVPMEPKPQLTAGHRPAAIVPQTMDEAYRLANAVCMAGMAPRGLDTPEKACVAIMHGLEIGLTPMAALQRIAVVNGRPTIWGDGAIGLVRGSGLCEFVRETIEGEGDKRVAVCTTKRKGEVDPVSRTFSVDDAKRAGLWGKQGPWQQYPERMLTMRARAFCLRDVYADVLGGLYLREELEDAPTPPAPPVRAPAPPAAQIEPPATPAAEPETPAPATPVEAPDYETIRKDFAAAAKGAQSHEDLQAAWDSMVEPFFDQFMPPDQEDITGIYRLKDREFEP